MFGDHVILIDINYLSQNHSIILLLEATNEEKIKNFNDNSCIRGPKLLIFYQLYMIKNIRYS